jgi:cytochrome c-type biogenesis protein CcmH/NrfG
VGKGLAVHPRDVDLNLELGDACRACGQHAVAAFAYRCALEAAPDRVDIRERLAALPPGIEH